MVIAQIDVGLVAILETEAGLVQRKDHVQLVQKRPDSGYKMIQQMHNFFLCPSLHPFSGPAFGHRTQCDLQWHYKICCLTILQELKLLE